MSGCMSQIETERKKERKKETLSVAAVSLDTDEC